MAEQEQGWTWGGLVKGAVIGVGAVAAVLAAPVLLEKGAELLGTAGGTVGSAIGKGMEWAAEGLSKAYTSVFAAVSGNPVLKGIASDPTAAAELFSSYRTNWQALLPDSSKLLTWTLDNSGKIAAGAGAALLANKAINHWTARAEAEGHTGAARQASQQERLLEARRRAMMTAMAQQQPAHG